VCVGSRGKYPGAPPHHRKDDKNKPTVKVPDRPSKVKGERLKKKNMYNKHEWMCSCTVTNKLFFLQTSVNYNIILLH
jgi:hypothetical protein